MELPLRTLKFGVDVGRKAHDFLTNVDLDSQIETAGLEAGQHVADDHDDLDPRGVHDLIVLALEDSDELADGVDELIQRGEPVAAEATLLAEELARLADGFDPLAAVSTEAVDWEAVAETFLETFELEVAAMEADQRWFLLQAYNQRVLAAVTADEFAEARANLTERGFDVVSDADFETEIENPRAAWREPFDWQHLANDYAVDRYHGDSDRTFTQQVLATLDGGGHKLLFGPPGSGKTVACRQAAAAWHHDDDTGPVIHWSGGLSGKRLDPDALEQAVDTVRELGDTLILVEDAARSRTLPIFEFLNGELGDASDVSVLLDAREYELDRLGSRVDDEGDGGEGQSVYNRLGALTERDRVPYLFVREVDEILDRFAETTDTARDVLPSAEAVFDHLTTVESREREAAATDDNHGETGAASTETDDAPDEGTETGADGAEADTAGQTARITPEQIRQTVGEDSSVSVASPMLMLSYYLPVTADGESVDTDASESPLEQRVRSVFEELHGSDGADADDSGPARLRREVVLTMATLAAADLPIHESYLYALADDQSGYDMVETTVDEFRGRVHFGRIGETTGEGRHVFRSPHELWGLTYLYVHENESGRATPRFENCVNTMFSVIDDESVRRELGRARAPFRGQTYLFELLDDDPTQLADVVVRRLFQIGRDRPRLVDLFETTRRSYLELPECCSDETFVMQSFWRSEMYRTVRGTDDWSVERGDTDEQRDERDGDDELHNSVVELLCARQTAMERDVETDWVEERFYEWLGRYARGQGDFRAAEWLFSLSLTRSRRRENDHGVASSFHALGRVARMRGDFDKAEERLRDCVEKLEETGDASDLAVVLHSLGNIARNRGEFDAAEEYHERSLSIEQEIGDRSGEAKGLHSLGNIAFQRGEFDEAEQFHQQSLSIFEEIGDRSMEAKSLGSLGNIARNRGEFDTAEEYHDRSLSIKQEIGDRSGEAKSLHSLGNIARNRGEFDAAEEYHDRSLSIKQEIGDRSGEAKSLGSLGNIAFQRGEFDAAEEYHDRSLSIKQEIGDRSGEAKSLGSLGNIAFQRGEFETAKDRYQSALAIFAELGQVREVIQTLQNLVRTAEELDDEAAAVEWVERGLTQLDDLDLAGLGEERRWFVTRYVRLDGDEDDLEGLYGTALEQLVTGKTEAASDLFEGVWDCRTSFTSETDAYGICLRAGVGYAAPAIQRDTDAAADVIDTVREAVESHPDRLSEPAAALHDLLVDDATDHDPDALREPADREEPDLDDLERFAYADLLEQLVGESKPLEIYRGTLRAIGTDEAEFEEVVNSCLGAWDQHTDVEGDQYRAALAAGVVLEAHREFADDLPRDRESVFGVVREHRELLTEPIEALFEYLDTGATDHDPDALREAADREEPDLDDLERIVVARLLTALQSQ